MQVSSDENTSYVDPQSKEEQNVKNTRPSIPMPHKIAWPPKHYDIKKTIPKEQIQLKLPRNAKFRCN